jgi:hypothetical protein
MYSDPCPSVNVSGSNFRVQISKSFLLLFFKKEVLPFFYLPAKQRYAS